MFDATQTPDEIAQDRRSARRFGALACLLLTAFGCVEASHEAPAAPRPAAIEAAREGDLHASATPRRRRRPEPEGKCYEHAPPTPVIEPTPPQHDRTAHAALDGALLACR